MPKVGSTEAPGVSECSSFNEGGSNRATPTDVKVFSSDIAFRDWTKASRQPPVRARAKSYSSFSRLSSFMAGSPRTAVKYYCSNPRKNKALQRSTKVKIEPATKTSLLLKQRKSNSGGGDGDCSR